MKNQYDYLSGKYAVWVKLKNRTGNIYDPITNTFNLTDEEWELEAKSWGPSFTRPRPTEEFFEHDSDDVQCTQMEPPGANEVGEELIKLARSLVEKNNLDNDIDACMEKLEKTGWEEDDAKYCTALLLFGESVDIRKVWLSLKPSSCESWVKNAGRKYGLFG
ncbi:hypothetical protein L2E82_29590 [Cichorium intybus]|uniref:Uncharacterized protein n=1 Tax=Cichorium intybus TaxID=13427 RepID=A0ACB9CY86_CICIN|nr:hypothetical protein L2E82_29590 [Cichorium intybus]